MNAAEITDKLGLHSLRQRAWVCFLVMQNYIRQLMAPSTSKLLVLLRVTVSMKVLSGSPIRSAKLAIAK